jgi:hypothetical protein
VGSTPAKLLWINPVEAEYCFKRDPELNWITIWENQISAGGCKSGFKKCGNQNGISEGVCIPNGKNCPITDIKIASSNPDPLKYTEIVGEANNLYYTNENGIADPLTEMWISESGVCLDSNFRSITDGRKDYVLMKKEGEACKEDTRFTQLGDIIGEQDLLDSNGVVYATQPGFNTNNNFKYDKLIRSMIAFKPSCRLLVENTEEGHKDITSLDSRNNFLSVSKQPNSPTLSNILIDFRNHHSKPRSHLLFHYSIFSLR